MHNTHSPVKRFGQSIDAAHRLERLFDREALHGVAHGTRGECGSSEDCNTHAFVLDP